MSSPGSGEGLPRVDADRGDVGLVVEHRTERVEIDRPVSPCLPTSVSKITRSTSSVGTPARARKYSGRMRAWPESLDPSATRVPRSDARPVSPQPARPTITVVNTRSVSRVASARAVPPVRRSVRTQATFVFQATSMWPASRASTWRS